MGIFNKKINKGKDEQPAAENQANFQDEPQDIKAEKNISVGTEAISLLEKQKNGLLDDESFLRSFGKVTIFYSTPFGDHKDGPGKLFALPAKDKTAYLPVFTSIARAKEHYDKVGRLGFLIMENSFVFFLKMIQKTNEGDTPIKFGAVIDPGYYGVTVDAEILDAVIEILK